MPCQGVDIEIDNFSAIYVIHYSSWLKKNKLKLQLG